MRHGCWATALWPPASATVWPRSSSAAWPRGRASPWRWPRTGRRPVRMSPSIPTSPRQPRSPAAPRRPRSPRAPRQPRRPCALNRPRGPQPTKRTLSSATEVCDDLARVLGHRCRRRLRGGPAHADRRDRQVPPHRGHALGDDPHQRLGLARARFPHGTGGRPAPAQDLAPHHRHRVPRRIYDVLNSQRGDCPTGSGTQVGGEPGQCPRHAGARDRCRGTGPVAGRTGLRPGPRRGPGWENSHRLGAETPPALVHTGTMRRYGWFLGIGAVLLCVLAWIVVGRSLADAETKLSLPIIVLSATTTSAPSNEPQLEESKEPQSPSSPPAGSANSDSANGDSTGAERITPAPPRHAGDDDDDDDRDESDDADDDVDDDDAYDEDDD